MLSKLARLLPVCKVASYDIILSFFFFQYSMIKWNETQKENTLKSVLCSALRKDFLVVLEKS